jgi:mannonate dehydratase
MKIKAAKVIVTCPGRNFATLRITTDEGVHGIVDTTPNGREQAVVAHFKEHVAPECCSTPASGRRVSA